MTGRTGAGPLETRIIIISTVAKCNRETPIGQGSVGEAPRCSEELRSQPLAGQFAGLPHPVDELSLVELALVDVEVAHALDLGFAERDRAQ